MSTTSTIKYEITVELPNGDWVWTNRAFADMHAVLVAALDYAHTQGGRVHHIERMPTNHVHPDYALADYDNGTGERTGVVHRVRPRD